MNKNKINKINKITKQPINKNNCINNLINNNFIFYNFFNSMKKNNNDKNNDKCELIPSIPFNEKKNNDKNKNNNNFLITNYFHYPINCYNFLNIVYNINNLNDLYNYIKNNKNTLLNETYIRILNNSWIELFNDINENFELFITINIFIFKELMKKNNMSDDLDDIMISDITNIIRKLLKKKRNKINYLEKLKEKLIINFL